MKRIVKSSLLILTLIIGINAMAQNAKVINLTQIEKDFKNQKELELKAGQAYVFEVTNESADKEVGFVIAPKGMYEQEHHIKNAYLQKMIAKGETSRSKEVVLEKGEYEYFCPMNPTPHYSITVN